MKTKEGIMTVIVINENDCRIQGIQRADCFMHKNGWKRAFDFVYQMLRGDRRRIVVAG